MTDLQTTRVPAYRLTARVGSLEFHGVLHDRPLRIGASQDNDFVVADATVSRQHARIWLADDGLMLADLSSRNGSWIDGRRVVGTAPLPAAARLRLGDVEIHLQPLCAGDAQVAPGTHAAANPTAAPVAPAPATLASGGLIRFCLRDLDALLRMIARPADADGFNARVLRALADAQTDAAFTLFDVRGALLARSGPSTFPASHELQRDDLTLRIEFGHEDARQPAAMLGELGLSLVLATRHATASKPPVSPAAGAHDALAVPLQTGNPALRDIYWRAARVARSRLNALVTGETGTGKELLARYLHAASGEPAARFAAMNCAALPGDLLDAELFGIEAGVATGVSARPGRFELAHGGTLFLDEIGDMSLDTQARILRVLQEREVIRVGGSKPRPADVRVVSATHHDLDAMVADGRFRRDLYHRIADWRVELPPLRARREDIVELAVGFLGEAARARNIRPGGLSRATVDALMRYSWPGNVRQLEREMARVALFLNDGEMVDSAMLASEIARAPARADGATSLSAQLERHEREIIARALAAAGGQVAAAAEVLGVSRATLYRRLGQLEIESG